MEWLIINDALWNIVFLTKTKVVSGRQKAQKQREQHNLLVCSRHALQTQIFK